MLRFAPAHVAVLAGMISVTWMSAAAAQPRHPLHPSLESSAPAPTPRSETAPNTDSQASTAQPARPAPQPQQMAQTAPPASPGVYTDAQLSNFVAASTEIQPLTANINSATPDQRAQVTAQIRAALQRHNIDSATYNAIATAAQTDTALAARINGMRSGAPPTGSASANPGGTSGQ